MYLYKNTTRYRAIVTVQVQSTENPKKALQIGSKAPQACEAELGFTDCDVGPGESIVPINNTQATIVGIRNAP